MNNFLNYLKKECKMNLECIKNIKFNKKSISVSLDKNNYTFFFNDMFNKFMLLRMIIKYYSIYSNKDIDYLEYKYQKINIRLV